MVHASSEEALKTLVEVGRSFCFFLLGLCFFCVSDFLIPELLAYLAYRASHSGDWWPSRSGGISVDWWTIGLLLRRMLP